VTVRIGYFTDFFPYQDPITGNIFKPSSSGGVGEVVYNLTVQMAKRGHEVYVFTTTRGEDDSLSRYGNISIMRYKPNFTVSQSSIALKHLIRPFFSNIDLDIAHSHGGSLPASVGGAIYAKRGNIPFIITHHGDSIGGFGTLGRRAGVFLYNHFLCDRLFSNGDKIIALSKSHLERSEILRKYRNKTTIIPNGLNLQDFQISRSQNECRTILNLPADEKIIFFLGSLTPRKGPHILLNAIRLVQKRYPKTLLILSGDGYPKDSLIEAATRNKLNTSVIFTGYVPENLKSLYYHAADIFVLPSFSEAFPLSLLEAGAAGLPVVATDVGGVSDILYDGVNGLITKTGDPEDLADKIMTLLGNNELREEMGKKGQMFAKQYSWDLVAEKTERIYLALTRRDHCEVDLKL